MDKYLLKAFEVLGKELHNLQLDCEVKDYEIKTLKEKIKTIEKFIEKYEVENGK